jgi:hypothetical protein
MLRTMELVLGLPPMSQYDTAATPMYAAFHFPAESVSVSGEAGAYFAHRAEQRHLVGQRCISNNEL